MEAHPRGKFVAVCADVEHFGDTEEEARSEAANLSEMFATEPVEVIDTAAREILAYYMGGGDLGAEASGLAGKGSELDAS